MHPTPSSFAYLTDVTLKSLTHLANISWFNKNSLLFTCLIFQNMIQLTISLIVSWRYILSSGSLSWNRQNAGNWIKVGWIIVRNWVETIYWHNIPILQLKLVYPRLHPLSEHTPVFGSHGWYMQWQVWVQLFPNFSESHATNRRKMKGNPIE
jgi:hypothetical protein